MLTVWNVMFYEVRAYENGDRVKTDLMETDALGPEDLAAASQAFVRRRVGLKLYEPENDAVAEVVECRVTSMDRSTDLDYLLATPSDYATALAADLEDDRKQGERPPA